MFKKLFSQRPKKNESNAIQNTAHSHSISEEDMLRYEFQDLLFQKVFETEEALHNEEDPMVIATRVMQTACELYDADWCGILIADLQTQAFIPEIWYEVGLGPMKDTLFNDIEFTEEFATWAQHLVDQEPMIIPDVEAIRNVSPKEYAAYQRLDARAIMGVPFGQHPLGFMVIRNMKRYADRPEPLRLACFVAMMMLEQIRRKRVEDVTRTDDVEDGRLRVRLNFLGPHNVVIKGRQIFEQDLKHPNRRAWITLLYLCLHKKPVDQYRLISENWPDVDEASARNNLRQALFRLNNELGSFYNDIKLVVLNNGMLDFSDQIRVTTDMDEMEELYKRAMNMQDGEDKIEILKKAFGLYRSRLFVQGEENIGGWLLQYTAHYNQLFVDITTELLKMLGRRKDYRCIMDYAPIALEKEPGMQTAYFWTVVAADATGNSVARDKALESAREGLTEEEHERLMNLLDTVGHAPLKRMDDSD